MVVGGGAPPSDWFSSDGGREPIHGLPSRGRPPSPSSARIEDLMKDGSTGSCTPAKQIGSLNQSHKTLTIEISSSKNSNNWIVQNISAADSNHRLDHKEDL